MPSPPGTTSALRITHVQPKPTEHSGAGATTVPGNSATEPGHKKTSQPKLPAPTGTTSAPALNTHAQPKPTAHSGAGAMVPAADSATADISTAATAALT